jgi:16S rRNA (uracil1498-N3)-methyltransferase
MYRFFVDRQQIDEEQGRIRIIGEDIRHIRNVLRMKQGEQLLLCTGRADDPWDYLCEIDYGGKAAPGDSCLEAVILEKRLSEAELPSRIILFQGLPKADKLESILQKSVELGVSAVAPVMMKRTIVRLDEKKAKNRNERWNAIALSAAKQAKRGVIPPVLPLLSWKEALEKAVSCRHILVPYESAEDISYTRNAIESVKAGESVAVFIGPEGGFEPDEIRDLKEAGARIITLGHRILRTETAGPALLAALMLHLER